MSISSLQGDIERLNKDLVSLNQKLARESKNEANKYSRIQSIEKSINKNTSDSTRKSKMHQIAQLQKEIGQSKDKQAHFQKDIATKTKTLSEKNISLTKEQTKENKKHQEALEKAQKEYNAFTSEWKRNQREQIEKIVSNSRGVYEQSDEIKYDVFISHASEDKEAFVDGLVNDLEKRNIKVWYDQNGIKWGDSIRSKIDEGLRNSRFGIIVISKTYLKKYWTNYEFDALLNRECEGMKIVLPIWYEVSKQDVMNYSPSLAGRMALNTNSFTTEEIADELTKILVEK